jgi:aryl-alcohol dehydrogenase-like predicted oxidoreductase
VTAILGVGLAALGRPAYIALDRDRDLGPFADRGVDGMRARAHSMLDAAWAAGVRYVDAARSYGRAEQFLGEWLAQHPERRAELTIGSKWGYRYVADWQRDVDVHEVKDHSLEHFAAQWPETLAALGSAPDLYLIHSVTPDSPALGDGALLDRLRALAAEGVRVGISTSGPHQGQVLDAARTLHASPFTVVQATINALEPSAAPALRRAHDAGWFVVAKEVFANGRLAASLAGAPATSWAQALAESTGLAPEAAALGWALAQPYIDVALSGAVTEQQLAANVAATALTAEQVAATTVLASEPAAYWAARSALPWQ